VAIGFNVVTGAVPGSIVVDIFIIESGLKIIEIENKFRY
jgi:hypothetical protein